MCIRDSYWMVCAWQDDFSGAIIDYGTHPDQGRAYFTLRDAQRTIQLEHRETAFEANLYAALDRCVTMLLTREFRQGASASSCGSQRPWA